MNLIDNFGRTHDYVRISLIDKCNLNCIYCNPDNSRARFDFNKAILSYEELYRLIKILVRDLNVKKIRFTGGEPLIRKDEMNFFEMISSIKKNHPFEIGITTNGTKLFENLDALYQFGIDRLNISLDTLSRTKFIAITGSDYFDVTLASIHKAIEIGFNSVKVNAVIIKNINDNELIEFVNYFKQSPITLRFIEYMPFAGNHWDGSKFIGWEEMKAAVEKNFELVDINSDGKISKDFLVKNNRLKIGFISSISNHFCNSCNRLRITASGRIKNCLFSSASENNLKKLLGDNSVHDEEIIAEIEKSLQQKWHKHPSVEELSQLNQNNMMSIGG